MNPSSRVPLTVPALIVASLLGACGDPAISATPRGERGEYAVDVRLEPARFEQQVTRFEAVGTGRANRSVTLFPDAGGEVVERAFKAGQYVAQGDVLLRLDERDERLAVDLAQVRLKDARQLYARYERAEGRSAILPTDIDSAQTAVETASIELARARVALERRRLTAPFAGYVGLSDIEVGDRVETATAITTLDERDPLLVRLDVPEAVSGQLRVGDPIVVSAWSGSVETRPATIVDIGSRIDPSTRTFTLQARVDNADDALRPGMSFRVALDILGTLYPVVPEVAVQWGANGAYIFRAVDGRAEQLRVGIVQRRAGEILVDAPLASGDLVVVEGVQRVRDGVTLRNVQEG